jgi:hypothetical protein
MMEKNPLSRKAMGVPNCPYEEIQALESTAVHHAAGQ